MNNNEIVLSTIQYYLQYFTHIFTEILTFTAIPYRSEEDDAAVGLLLGTLSDDVSMRCIFLIGISRTREHT